MNQNNAFIYLAIVLSSWLIVQSRKLPENINDLPGECKNCGEKFKFEICSLKEPCTIGKCRKGCVIANSWNQTRRALYCYVNDNKNENMFECFDDRNCQHNEKCCHTETGSYCSSGPIKPHDFEGKCFDCGFTRQQCGIVRPCKPNIDCQKACLYPRSYGDTKRPKTCDPSQNLHPNVYQCVHHGYCEENERCCYTSTESYCSREVPSKIQQIFSDQLSRCFTCRYDTEVCDFKQPCGKSKCQLDCVKPKSTFFASSASNIECDPSQNTQPNIFQCWHDSRCGDFQRCCITNTGSYCSKRK